ncbi:MAG: hypothetical protein MNPFHGCM_02087 [Gemmatimonadaceae bacterium]|nr:hypothetical protein [Gemmatimonadaceae bacterium]
MTLRIARALVSPALLAALLIDCRPEDSDIAPDLRSRARATADAPVAFLDTDREAVVLAPGAAARLTATAYDSLVAPLTSRPVNYRTLDPTVATVGADGLVRAIAGGLTAIVAESGAAADTIPVRVAHDGGEEIRVEIFPARSFQRIDGWEAHHQSGELDCQPSNFVRYRDELFDRAVTELGINRVRLEVRSGMEAPNLHAPGGNEPQSTAVSFGTPWFSPQNDNDDPFVADSSGFQFGWFDYNVAQSVVPLRDRLAARGERLYLVLTYVDFFRTTPYEQMENPEEYAELIAVTFEHLHRRFGFVPDAVEVILEPDNTPWTPEQVGRALVAAGDRLRASGFHPEFIAPSTTNLAEAVRSYDRLRLVPRVGEYLTVLSYHRYSGVSSPALHQLKLRARRDGLRLAMLEHTEGTASELHDDLTRASASAWERFALAFCGANANPDATGVYYQVQLRAGSPPRLVFTNSARLLRHYFAFVRHGAVRIAAASSDGAVSPVAFRNTDGGTVVVIRTSKKSGFAIGGLPAGRYTVLWSLDRAVRSERFTTDLGAGALLQGAIPGSGFVTIYAQRAESE